jgi:hypothetical protein
MASHHCENCRSLGPAEHNWAAISCAPTLKSSYAEGMCVSLQDFHLHSEIMGMIVMKCQQQVSAGLMLEKMVMYQWVSTVCNKALESCHGIATFIILQACLPAAPSIDVSE